MSFQSLKWQTAALLLVAVSEASAVPQLSLSGPARVEKGSAATLQLRLSAGDEPYGGFNARIGLPKGVAVTGVSRGALLPVGSTIDHRVWETDTRVWLALVGYSNTASISGTDGVLLRIGIRVTDAARAAAHTIAFAASNPNPAINAMHALSDARGARSVEHAVSGLRVTIAPPLDTDGDGIPDATDPDDDNDGHVDGEDAFPLDPTEWLDTDGDGTGNNADTDDDGDGVPDAQDSAPLDAKNTGPVIALAIDSLDMGLHGWRWGDKAYRTVLAATFTSNGQDRLLHVQGFDVDRSDELELRLNDRALGHLTLGADGARGKKALWWLPVVFQAKGENRVEIRQKTSGEMWGVTQLGLFGAGVAFGNLKSLSGGDLGHGAGFELHLPHRDVGYLLGITGYDSDTSGEIQLALNGSPLVDLPKGPDAAWTAAYQLLLPASLLGAGDNRLDIANQGPATEDWGLRLDGNRAFGAPLGQIDALPAEQRHGSLVRFLVPPRAGAMVLDYHCHDADTAAELRLVRDGVEQGFCPPTGDGAWGKRQSLALPAKERHVFLIDNRLNPPAEDPWRVRLTGWLADAEADGVPDIRDNCKQKANPDQKDLDGDALGDVCDPDRDGDGVANIEDAFPLDPTEWLDSDGDGSGNNADLDDDNDGFPDGIDPDPLDPDKVPPARVGVHRPGERQFILDSDGDGRGSGGDAVLGPLGQTTDLAISGDWNGDGLDEVGFYRPGTRVFFLDFDGDGRWTSGEPKSAPFGAAGDLPLAGDWDGDGQDEIGTYNPTTRQFTLDLDGSLSATGSDLTTAAFGQPGDLPVAGDWRGDGIDRIGVWRPDARRFLLDANGSGTWNGTTGGDTLTATFGAATDLPVVGDWNGNGIDEVGVWRPSTGRFMLDLNGDGRWDGNTGGDLQTGAFGASTDRPISGRWSAGP